MSSGGWSWEQDGGSQRIQAFGAADVEAGSQRGHVAEGWEEAEGAEDVEGGAGAGHAIRATWEGGLARWPGGQCRCGSRRWPHTAPVDCTALSRDPSARGRSISKSR